MQHLTSVIVCIELEFPKSQSFEVDTLDVLASHNMWSLWAPHCADVALGRHTVVADSEKHVTSTTLFHEESAVRYVSGKLGRCLDGLLK